ncbi:MAG: nicotinate-nucleotide--dimethylbenzimidazole phosphoribosyltransferase, partial [Tabrizicola sp.]
MPFQTLADVRAVLRQLPVPDTAAIAAAEARNGQLTKPPGALGRLERLAIWMAGWQGTDRPRADKPQIVIFAGNHGVTAKGVSAFPAEVTAQMVANFAHGGAAINQLARTFGAKLDVHALELDRPTADFTEAPAMTEAEVVSALRQGYGAVDPEADLFVAGEMGIGNTTAAAAIATALYGGTGWAGRGTGIDDEGLRRKEAAVAAGLERHAAFLSDPLEVLRCLGGREIAAMAGAILGARRARVPVILDGFIACA